MAKLYKKAGTTTNFYTLNSTSLLFSIVLALWMRESSYISHLSFTHLREIMTIDNPPIGILLCTRKGKKMVEYALAGMDNQLFVSTYMLQLPDKKTLEDFLLKQLRGQEC